MIVALSAESREKVDEMINRVIEAGGRESRATRPWMDVCTQFSGS